jgi:Fe-S-cluster containining protein
MENGRQSSNGSAGEDICLGCGLCCDGTIFADVELRPTDEPSLLRKLGLPVGTSRASRSPSRPAKFAQPCAALQGCHCRIYQQRPTHCREFECVLLKSVKAGSANKSAALRVIRTARERADRVRQMLRELGDSDEDLPLRRRFRRTTKRLEELGLNAETADLYGRLTLAVHELNLLLSQAFYPGPS